MYLPLFLPKSPKSQKCLRLYTNLQFTTFHSDQRRTNIFKNTKFITFDQFRTFWWKLERKNSFFSNTDNSSKHRYVRLDISPWSWKRINMKIRSQSGSKCAKCPTLCGAFCSVFTVLHDIEITKWPTLCGSFCVSFTVLYDNSTGQNDPYVGHFVLRFPPTCSRAIGIVGRINLRLDIIRNSFFICQSKVGQKMPTNLLYSEWTYGSFLYQVLEGMFVKQTFL